MWCGLFVLHEHNTGFRQNLSQQVFILLDEELLLNMDNFVFTTEAHLFPVSLARYVVVVLTIVFSCIGMIFNFRMLKNIFGMSSTP